MDDMNLVELVEKFADEEKCRSYIEALRWPDGVKCPRCKANKVYRILKRDQFVCDSCSYQFSATSGTIFHDSHLPLWKWLLAVYLVAESKKGMSANQLKRTLAVSYKTAWYLCHRIRKAMAGAKLEPLKGVVEMDETYIGGKRHHVGSGYVENKTMVLGVMQRGGHAHLRAEKRKPTMKVLREFIHAQVDLKNSRLMTDEHPAYQGTCPGTVHQTVNHQKEEWVRGDVHTNRIENAWSLFKRSVVGSYHKISRKHLDAYLDEFEWRFNNRENPFLFRDTVQKLIASPNLAYKKLTKKEAA
jgi:transposase-like protein